MDERIGVAIRFEAFLLPAMSAASPAHVKALQRLIAPIIYGALRQLYSKAESDAARIDPRQLVCLFQQRLSNSDDFESVRKELLAQLLGSRDDPGGVQYVNAVKSAFFSRLHVLIAAHPHLCQSFHWRSGGNSSARAAAKNSAPPNYRVSANCTPLTFLHLIYAAASKAVFKNPFLFIKDVSAEKFVERRRACMDQIDDIIDSLLYDKCNEMVIRLWKEMLGRAKADESQSQQSLASLSSSRRSTGRPIPPPPPPNQQKETLQSTVSRSRDLLLHSASEASAAHSKKRRERPSDANTMIVQLPMPVEYSADVDREQIPSSVVDQKSSSRQSSSAVPTIKMMDGSRSAMIADPLGTAKQQVEAGAGAIDEQARYSSEQSARSGDDNDADTDDQLQQEAAAAADESRD